MSHSLPSSHEDKQEETETVAKNDYASPELIDLGKSTTLIQGMYGMKYDLSGWLYG